MHNYLIQKDIPIDYAFNEALCDVVGNYGAVRFAREAETTGAWSTVRQARRNRKIYRCLNKTISSIHSHPSEKIRLQRRAESKIARVLITGDEFQKDRFNYPVNNGYLLKNQYYSRNYFILEKVLERQPSLKDFLKLLAHLPEKSFEYEAYFRSFL